MSTSIAARRSAKVRSGAGKHLFVSTNRVTPLPVGNLRLSTVKASPKSQHTPFSACVISTTQDLSHDFDEDHMEKYSYPATAGLMDCDYNPDTEELYYKDGPAMILPNLYLGSMHVVANKELINRFGIKFVLNVAKEVDNPFISTTSSPSPKVSAGQNFFEAEEFNCAWSQGNSWSDASSIDTTYTQPLTPSPLDDDTPDYLDAQPHISKFSGAEALTPPQKTRFVPPTYMKLHWGHNHDHVLDDFDSAFSYIEAARRSGVPVLVACQQGISRSASLVVAFVMKSLGISLAEAYAFVKSRSPNICPNVSLIGQLAEYEHILQQQHNEIGNLC